MKSIRSYPAIAIVFIALFLTSCGSDDDEGMTNFDYMPLAVDNQWDYTVATGAQSSTESMRVASSSGTSYMLESSTATPAGLMTTVLTGGTLRNEGGKLIGTGSSVFDFQGIQDLTIDITDAPFYDQNSPVGTELYATTALITQEIEGFDADIEYTVRTVQLEDIASMTVDGMSYENVIHSQLIVNARIGTELGIGGLTTTINFLQPQDVITVDNYWAENVGLIKSDNQFQYMLEDLSSFGVNLAIPRSANILTTQDLNGFSN